MSSVDNFGDKISQFFQMSTYLKKLREMLMKLEESFSAEIVVQNVDNTEGWEHIQNQSFDAVVGDEEYFNDLKNMCRVNGWQITEYKALENNKLQITIHFNKSGYFVKLTKNGSFALLQVYPALPSFPLIKELLSQSQDLSALLRVCKKLFSINMSTSAPIV